MNKRRSCRRGRRSRKRCKSSRKGGKVRQNVLSKRSTRQGEMGGRRTMWQRGKSKV